MPIAKTVATQNNATAGYHKAVKLSVDMLTITATVSVQSWVDEAAYLAVKPIAWNWEVAVPLVSLTADVVGSAENALTTNSTSPFLGGTIVADNSLTLDTYKAKKRNALKELCHAQIVSGFASSALGTAHNYPQAELDQTNMVGSVVSSLIPGIPANWTTYFWCQDSAGVWAFVSHTATQIQVAGQDSKTSILIALGKNDRLGQQVLAATTQSQVDAVVW